MERYAGTLSCAALSIQISLYALARTRVERSACDHVILGASEFIKLVISGVVVARSERPCAALKVRRTPSGKFGRPVRSVCTRPRRAAKA